MTITRANATVLEHVGVATHSFSCEQVFGTGDAWPESFPRRAGPRAARSAMEPVALRLRRGRSRELRSEPSLRRDHRVGRRRQHLLDVEFCDGEKFFLADTEQEASGRSSARRTAAASRTAAGRPGPRASECARGPSAFHPAPCGGRTPARRCRRRGPGTPTRTRQVGTVGEGGRGFEEGQHGRTSRRRASPRCRIAGLGPLGRARGPSRFATPGAESSAVSQMSTRSTVSWSGKRIPGRNRDSGVLATECPPARIHDRNRAWCQCQGLAACEREQGGRPRAVRRGSSGHPDPTHFRASLRRRLRSSSRRRPGTAASTCRWSSPSPPSRGTGCRPAAGPRSRVAGSRPWSLRRSR